MNVEPTYGGKLDGESPEERRERVIEEFNEFRDAVLRIVRLTDSRTESGMFVRLTPGELFAELKHMSFESRMSLAFDILKVRNCLDDNHNTERYDQSGCGLSDPWGDHFTLDRRIKSGELYIDA